MYNRSIAYRLSIYISLAVIGIFIVFILTTFFFTNEILNKSLEDMAVAESSQIIRDVERYLVSTSEITESVADQTCYYTQNDDLELLLKMIMQKYVFLNAIHINLDTSFTTVKYSNYFIFRGTDSLEIEKDINSIHHCEYEKRHFETLAGLDYSGWTETFPCDRNGNLIVSYHAPVRLKNKDNTPGPVLGSVITELSLLTLSDSIQNIKIRNKGYATLVSRDGRYLSHPNSDWIFTRNVYSLPDKAYDKENIDLKQVLEGNLSGSSFVYSEYLGNEKCWVYATPVKDPGWTLFILIPVSELYHPLYILILRMLFFSILGILVIYYIVTYISNRLIQPLSKVTAQLQKFSTLSGSRIDTMNEIKVVSESLDSLRNWYRNWQIKQQQEEQRNERRINDLMEASEIQMSLINTDFTQFSHRSDIDLYALYKPAGIVSGDLYDFFFLDEQRLFVSVGDVSGKGVSAAFFMSVAQTLIKGNARRKRIKDTVQKVNSELYTANHHQFFLTLFAGVLNVKTGEFTFCNAGHTSAFIIKANKEVVALEETHGMPLGIYPDKKYQEDQIVVNKGDYIVLYTDGVLDLQNEKGETFGIKNFRKKLVEFSDLPPSEMMLRLKKAFKKFRGNQQQIDDITILAIQIK